MTTARVSTFLTLIALALAAPSFARADDGGAEGSGHHHGGWKKFAACVKENGGTLPELTPAQRKTSRECFKDNHGSQDQVKACLDKAGIPAPDAATQVAIGKCKGQHPHKAAS